MKTNRTGLAGLTIVAASLTCALATAADNPKPNPERDAYFGETHIHTSWSVDAWVIGNRLTGPDDAYKYAQGETIKHPLGYDIHIDTPLDWMGVTDHSEYVGVTKEANTPGSTLSKLPEAQGLILKDPKNPEDVQRVFLYLLSLTSKPPIKAFMSPEVAGSIWSENVKIADANNHPGKFTAFCSYEYTSQFNNRNLHRNIFFRDCAKVPLMPFSMLDSWHPEDLWGWMDTQRKAGNELLAISHNANLSDGWMYPTDVDSLGRPIDAAWAASRERNERLIEIKQIKGSVRDASAAVAERRILELRNHEHPARIARRFRPHSAHRRQLRAAGVEGRSHAAGRARVQPVQVRLRRRVGFAQHRRVRIGRTTSSAAMPRTDGTIQQRMSGHIFNGIDTRVENPAGLTGAWAEQNTRASIWDAMYRKETFGTSGPADQGALLRRLGLRQSVDRRPRLDQRRVQNGCADGQRSAADERAAAPTFAVWAMKDPTSGNLDRIQIVKGWSKNGQSFEKIYDVVWSGDRKADKWTHQIPPIASTVDIDNGTYTNSVGSPELKTTWTDPDFDRVAARLLLRARSRNSDAALDDDSGARDGHRAAGYRSGDGAGTRVGFADLVHARRLGT